MYLYVLGDKKLAVCCYREVGVIVGSKLKPANQSSCFSVSLNKKVTINTKNKL
jgi:hypothetical protein